MPTPLLSLDAALAFLARPPWVNPVDGGNKRQLPPLSLEPAVVEHARTLAATLRGDEATALDRWMLHDPEHAAGALLAAGTRDAWMALRLLSTRDEAYAEVLTAAHVLGVREPVAAARLDDPLLCHPLEFPQLPARLPAVALRGDIAHARRGTTLHDDEVRRLVELAGAPRSFGRHPALPVLRAALVDDDRNALATALQRLDPHLRAAARLGDEAARERLFARARSSGQPDAPCDALVAADAVW
ncbi:MAG: hypothetical protein K1X88_22320, partial [Nannocystaceae bacterium]|nr:hypothetical protein [Nannocystaceae bacterium]